MVSAAHRNNVEKYIKKGVDEGGRLLLGGKRPSIPGHEEGYYVQPTVIQIDNHDSAIVMEESSVQSSPYSNSTTTTKSLRRAIE
jgi:betaine-aldehyde dehydrogenase